MTLIRKTNPVFPSWLEDFWPTEFQKFQNVESQVPAVNVHEDADKFTLELAAPGLKKEDFKVEMEHGSLVISSKKEESKEEKDPQGKYTRKEFSYHSFRRAFRLPEKSIDAEGISARYADGVLYVTIPKKEEVKTRPVRAIDVA